MSTIKSTKNWLLSISDDFNNIVNNENISTLRTFGEQLSSEDNEQYIASHINMPPVDYSLLPDRYFFILLPKKICEEVGGCRSGVSLIGRAYAASDEVINEASPQDFFMIAELPGKVESSAVRNSSSRAKNSVMGCIEVQRQIMLSGSLSVRMSSHISSSRTVTTDDSETSLHCFRDQHGGFDLIADTIISWQYENGEMTTASPIQDDMHVMLAAHYQPGDDLITWYGIEVQVVEDEGSSNSTYPALVPTTSIVFRQELNP